MREELGDIINVAIEEPVCQQCEFAGFSRVFRAWPRSPLKWMCWPVIGSAASSGSLRSKSF